MNIDTQNGKDGRISTVASVTSRSFKEAFLHAAGISVGVAGSVLASLLVERSGGENISRSVLFLALGTLTTFSLISAFVFILKDRTEDISRLKQEVTRAFLKSLDESSFNPRRLEEKNEQSSPQPTG
ncbi:MAG: hypothetical protein ACREA9_24120 [Pyrinomonadaceae bacterium]